MQGFNLTLIPLDSKIKRTTRAIWEAKRKELLAKEELEEEKEDMSNPPIKMMGDYCRRIDDGQISLDFQLANPVIFDIKFFMFSGLRDNSFDGQDIQDPYEHLDKIYETYPMCKPNDKTGYHIKLRLFGFFNRSSKGLDVVHSKWYDPNMEGIGRNFFRSGIPLILSL